MQLEGLRQRLPNTKKTAPAWHRGSARGAGGDKLVAPQSRRHTEEQAPREEAPHLCTHASEAECNPPPPRPLSSAAARPWLPEDVAEEERGAIPQSPVVVEGVDGGGQRLQDAVEDTAHQRADVGPQAEVRVPNQAARHLQEPVQLLQVVADRFHLRAEEAR